MASSTHSTLGEKILYFIIIIFIVMLLMFGVGFYFTMLLVKEIGSIDEKLPHGALTVYDKSEEFVCNTNLVTTTWSLTTARCVEIINDLNSTMVLWFIRTGTKRWAQPGSRRLVKGYVRHPDYDPDTMEHNLGLVEVVEPFDDIYVMDWNKIGFRHKIKKGVIAGWVQPFYSILMVEDIFEMRPITQLEDNKCKERIEDFGLSMNNTLCIEPLAENVCFPGDGYALMVRGKMVAIRSWGDTCTGIGPHVLTVLYPYMDWIKLIVKK